MKKIMRTLILTLGLVSFAGCAVSNSTGETVGSGKVSNAAEENAGSGKVSNAAEENAGNDKVSNSAGESVGSIKFKKAEPLDYIQSAIDYANKIGGAGLIMDDEENFYISNAGKDLIISLYCCYGKEVSQIRQTVNWGDVRTFILTGDGDVYLDNFLLSSGKNITDMAISPNVGLARARFLMENGNYIIHYDIYEIADNEHTVKSGGAVAAAQWDEFGIVLGADGNFNCDYWEGCEIKDWKDVAVLAFKKNEATKKVTIAGISANGTVYATGEYAEDILSWGELAYISMDEQLIVGLKKDGTLAFTGELGEACAAWETIGSVKGVRLRNGQIWAITEDDVLYGSYDKYSVEIGSATFRFKMDKDGNIYKNENEEWVSTDYPKADAENTKGLTWYQLLLSRDDIYSFAIKDLNNDGRDEIIAKMEDGKQKIYANYGHLENLFTAGAGSYEIVGYYPNAGVIVSKSEMSRFTSTTYTKLFEKEKVFNMVAGGGFLSMTEYYSDSEDRFYKGVENKEENKISEEEFHEILKSYIGEEEMCVITNEDFVDNNENNLITIFGIDTMQ